MAWLYARPDDCLVRCSVPSAARSRPCHSLEYGARLCPMCHDHSVTLSNVPRPFRASAGRSIPERHPGPARAGSLRWFRPGFEAHIGWVGTVQKTGAARLSQVIRVLCRRSWYRLRPGSESERRQCAQLSYDCAGIRTLGPARRASGINLKS